MLDGFLVIFIAVAIPAYILTWIVGNSRKKDSDRKSEETRVLTEYWKDILPATDEEIARAAKLAMYNPPDGDIVEKFMPTPEKMAAYYFDTLGLAEDFRAIYGPDWREKAKIVPDPYAVPQKGTRAPAVWRVKGFRTTESREIEHAVEAILLSREGKIRRASSIELNITVVPDERAPWANRWFLRIEENLRRAGQDVDLYVCAGENRGKRIGAFFAPDVFLTKLDELEELHDAV